ncbi:MAG: hypothetical protein WBA93_34745 [Microcoleaceae cyanobacterium]
MFTKSGVNFFFPTKVSVIIFRNPALRFQTGSIAEFILLIFIFAGSIGIFNLHSQGGLIRIYEQALGNQSSAIDYYNAHSNQYLIMAKVEGFRSSDRQAINQEYRVLKIDGSVFILQDSQGYIYRAGNSGNVEILIEKIRVNQGETASTETKIVTLKDEPILEKLNSLQAADEVYVFGSLEKVDDVNSLNFPVSNNYLWPIWVEGEKLIFYAARLEQLEVNNRYGTGELRVMIVNY